MSETTVSDKIVATDEIVYVTTVHGSEHVFRNAKRVVTTEDEYVVFSTQRREDRFPKVNTVRVSVKG